MSEVLLRQLKMLELVPRWPRKVTTAVLEAQLQERGFSMGRRTIQRDLLVLSRMFPLECDEHKPRGWRWARNANITELPAMDPQTALTFQLVERFLPNLLPRNTLKLLEPHFERAGQILRNISRPGLQSWMGKIEVLSPGIPLLPPQILPEVMDVIYGALLEEQRISIEYSKRGASKTKTYEISPLGLVLLGHLIYLVGAFREEEYVVRLPINRISRAEQLEKPVHVPAEFSDLRAYVNSGVFNVRISADEIPLRLRVDSQTAEHLREVRLSRKQRIQKESEEVFLITATVRDTDQLRWWLRGFGAKVEVLAPQSLREELRAEAEAVGTLYQK